MTPFAIGVDLGGTNLRIAAVDHAGTILERVSTGTEVARRDRVIDDMCSAIANLSKKHSGSKLLGIGVGVPGIIDLKTGMLRWSPNLPGWQEYPVHKEIERRLGTTVILENDANVAALGEKWLGAGAAVDDMCMITLGTGVGGGLILQGRIWHGMLGMAGEVGHINVQADGPACGCGSRGCLEQFASAKAVKRMASEVVAGNKAPALAQAFDNGLDFDAKVVYEMAMQGDSAAQQIFRRFGNALGIAVAGLINIFNLPMFVIGGGVSSAWDAFAPAMLETVRAYSYVYRATEPAAGGSTSGCTMIARSLLGSDAGLVGAARLAMQNREPLAPSS